MELICIRYAITIYILSRIMKMDFYNYYLNNAINYLKTNNLFLNNL